MSRNMYSARVMAVSHSNQDPICKDIPSFVLPGHLQCNTETVPTQQEDYNGYPNTEGWTSVEDNVPANEILIEDKG